MTVAVIKWNLMASYMSDQHKTGILMPVSLSFPGFSLVAREVGTEKAYKILAM